jgi:hypothetical protein
MLLARSTWETLLSQLEVTLPMLVNVLEVLMMEPKLSYCDIIYKMAKSVVADL